MDVSLLVITLGVKAGVDITSVLRRVEARDEPESISKARAARHKPGRQKAICTVCFMELRSIPSCRLVCGVEP